MNPQEAVEAAELAEAEAAYRHQLARECTRPDSVLVSRPATARRRPTGPRGGPRSSGLSSTESATPSSRNAGGDPADELISQSRGPATSPAGPPSHNHNHNQNQRRRQKHERTA